MKKYKFHELFEMISGVVLELNDYTKTGIKILKIENIKNGYIDESNCLMTEKVFDNKFYTKTGDILVALNRPIINGKLKIGQVKESGLLVFQRVGIIRKKHNNKYKEDYCFKILQKAIEKYALKNMIGGLIPFLKNSELNNIEFLMDENNSIEINKKVNNEINKIEKIKKLLEKIEIRNQYYADKLLSGEYTIEENKVKGNNKEYNTIKIIDYIELINGYSFKSNEMKNDGKYPVIKMNNFNKGKIEITKNTTFTNNLIDKVILKSEDLLVGLSGSVGEYAVFNNNDICLLNQRCIVIRNKKNKEIADYIKIYIINKTLDLLKRSSEGGVIKNVSSTFFYDLEIPLPDNFTEITSFINLLNNEKQTVQRLLELEEKRFEWLSDKLLSGEYIIED